MQHIGRKLKEARERQGISLVTVTERTKVSLRYLQAIESGAFHVIPGEVYLKGFIRSYARVVGLDGDELLRAHLSCVTGSLCTDTVSQGNRLTRLAHGVWQGVFRSSHRLN